MQLEGSPIKPLPSSQFHPSSLLVAVNVLWFASLLFSLFAALVGILAKQWIHVYSKWDEGPSDQAETKLRLRDLYQQGLVDYHVPEIIGLLPVFLQIALLLFIVGLTAFLWKLQVVVAGIVTSMSAVGVILAVYTIIRPIFDRRCMYKTPLVIFAAVLWDSLFQLAKNYGSSHKKKIRSYTRWRDHDIQTALNIREIEAKDDRTLTQISLLLEVRPVLSQNSLNNRKDLGVQMHELDPKSRELLYELLFSLLSAAYTHQDGQISRTAAEASLLPQVLRLVYPSPDMDVLTYTQNSLKLHHFSQSKLGSCFTYDFTSYSCL